MSNIGRKILVVDDLYPNLYLMETILEDAGYGVITASTGDEGVDFVVNIGKNC